LVITISVGDDLLWRIVVIVRVAVIIAVIIAVGRLAIIPDTELTGWVKEAGTSAEPNRSDQGGKRNAVGLRVGGGEESVNEHGADSGLIGGDGKCQIEGEAKYALGDETY
jgi:hypothetical protein